MPKRPSLLQRLFGQGPDKSQADASVRSVLAEHGDDGSIPRPTDFFFYGGNIQALIKTAAAAGFSTRPTATQPGVILTGPVPVDEDGFNQLEAQMQDWAEKFGSEFDGWETQVVRN